MIKVVYIGDIVGEAGRKTLAHFLVSLNEEYNYDLLVVNGENVTHGRGLSFKHYRELIALGVDAISLGNHYDDRNEIRQYLPSVYNVVRPYNLTHNYPGTGTIVVTTKNGVEVRITNILGQSFMKEVVTSPLVAISEIINNNPHTIHIIDYHAETTAEKQTIAWYFDGKITALLGTHTHVQTADNRLLEKGTAFISDMGMTGAYNGIIGVERTSVIDKMWFDNTVRFNYENSSDDCVISGVCITIDEKTSKAISIERIYKIWEKNHG